ncbi:Hypothetical protein I596_3354 [Dokdonella koreensis DS-123]|uniref:Uncharacterized protein n=1 Tax=Dokdonella koreensis DS-123 TaxID=1300342 RepID=A0A160DYV8_9GAMM|nr:Hypothetical protein I596_3354 [Dokdonella koreensis DS-123]
MTPRIPAPRAPGRRFSDAPRPSIGGLRFAVCGLRRGIGAARRCRYRDAPTIGSRAA